jgi:hypothetical protein
MRNKGEIRLVMTKKIKINVLLQFYYYQAIICFY